MPQKNTRTTRLEDGISITGVKPSDTRTTPCCLEGSTSTTGYAERVHEKHTCTSRLEDGISITGGGAPGPARHQAPRLEDGISVTGGGAPGRRHHTLQPGRQYLHNQYVKCVHGKHTCTTRLEDGISITGGEAPGQTHHTLLPGRQYINNRVCKSCRGMRTRNSTHPQVWKTTRANLAAAPIRNFL